MAIAIKSIPILRQKAANKFARVASVNASKKGTVSFGKQVKTANSILAKAKL